jgi:opacity protein-like surface antigen
MKRQTHKHRSNIIAASLCAAALSLSATTFAEEAAAPKATDTDSETPVNNSREEKKERNYTTLNLQFFNFDHKVYNALNTTALQLKYGRNIGDDIGGIMTGWLAVEAHLNIGMDILDDTSTEFIQNNTSNHELATSSADFSIGYGLFARTDLPVHEKIHLYGLFGVSQVEIELDISNDNYSSEETFDSTSAAYGLGLDILLADNLGIEVELMHYNVGSSYNLVSASAGISYKF